MRSRVGCRGKPFEVHDFGDKGMGVVAARDIQKGELLLREQPLFLVSQCRDSRQLDAWENEINAALRKLPEHDLQSFWNLADCHTDEKSVVGIVRTNGLPVETAEGDMVGVYPTVSRFNHSCNNNVNNSYQEEYGEVLHAIRDVAKGEELCITYIDLFMTRQERQDVLRRTFNFKCACPTCLQTGQALLRSNKVRQRLQDLRSALPSAVPQRLGPRVLEKIAEHIDEELGGNAAAKAYAYHMGSQLLRDIGQSEGDLELQQQATTFAEKALAEVVVAEGPESWVSVMLRESVPKAAQTRGIAARASRDIQVLL